MVAKIGAAFLGGGVEGGGGRGKMYEPKFLVAKGGCTLALWQTRR